MSDMQAKGLLAPDLFFPGGNVGVLLIHGLGGTPVEMRYLAQGLSRAGITVCCPLLKGHGGSDLLLSTARWPDWVASARSAYDRLAETCDTIFVCGQSAGALVAIHLAADRNRPVAGLVCCSPTFWPDGWAIPKSLRLFKVVREHWTARFFNFAERAPYGIKDERLRRFVLDSLRQDGRPLADIFGRSGNTVLEFRRLADQARRKLQLVEVPTLVVHAREDDQADMSNAFRVLKGIKGPSELVLLEDSYHLVTLDRQRDVVLERVSQFTARISSGIARARDRHAAESNSNESGSQAATGA